MEEIRHIEPSHKGADKKLSHPPRFDSYSLLSLEDTTGSPAPLETEEAPPKESRTEKWLEEVPDQVSDTDTDIEKPQSAKHGTEKRAFAEVEGSSEDTDHYEQRQAELTSKNLSLFNKMAKTKASCSTSGDSAGSDKSMSTTAPGFAMQARNNGIFTALHSSAPTNVESIRQGLDRSREGSPEPSEDTFQMYRMKVNKSMNEHSMQIETSRRLLKEFKDHDYQTMTNQQFTGLPKGLGFNNSLSAPQPDFVEGMEAESFYPFPIDRKLRAAIAVKGDLMSVTLAHLVGEWKSRDGDMSLARTQCAYDGAAMVYARNEALHYMHRRDKDGHSKVISFTINGTDINVFAHHSNTEDGEKVQYHQYLVKSYKPTESLEEFRKAYQAIRNAQDMAYDRSKELRDLLLQFWRDGEPKPKTRSSAKLQSKASSEQTAPDGATSSRQDKTSSPAKSTASNTTARQGGDEANNAPALQAPTPVMSPKPLPSPQSLPSPAVSDKESVKSRSKSQLPRLEVPKATSEPIASPTSDHGRATGQSPSNRSPKPLDAPQKPRKENTARSHSAEAASSSSSASATSSLASSKLLSPEAPPRRRSASPSVQKVHRESRRRSISPSPQKARQSRDRSVSPSRERGRRSRDRSVSPSRGHQQRQPRRRSISPVRRQARLPSPRPSKTACRETDMPDAEHRPTSKDSARARSPARSRDPLPKKAVSRDADMLDAEPKHAYAGTARPRSRDSPSKSKKAEVSSRDIDMLETESEEEPVPACKGTARPRSDSCDPPSTPKRCRNADMLDTERRPAHGGEAGKSGVKRSLTPSTKEWGERPCPGKADGEKKAGSPSRGRTDRRGRDDGDDHRPSHKDDRPRSRVKNDLDRSPSAKKQQGPPRTDNLPTLKDLFRR